jgi:glycine/D-amino acid oxidase-like deaminating enzyme
VTLWEAKNGASGIAQPLRRSIKTDIIVIGAGIIGSFIAERLSRANGSITVLDRNRPQMASTAASTALLLWEIDTPLSMLAEMIGFEAGSRGISCKHTGSAKCRRPRGQA